MFRDYAYGFRPNEAEEDLGWYDTGLGHMYMDPLIKLHLEQRSNPNGISPRESKEVAKYRYAWLAMIMKIYQKMTSNNGKTIEKLQLQIQTQM
mmetsp:Transcript_9249/g.11676  ORF Transcript_9249/g.11676 Transcript_9249/m.11676 type:complete len:93 (-) Transcript_9249:848-1126(-)